MHQQKSRSFDLTKKEFTALGYWLVDRLAEHFDGLDKRDVTPGETPAQVRAALGNAPLPLEGIPAHEVMARAHDLLMGHSLFPGHPRFWGYIIGAGTQIGVLSEMLGAAVNPNIGGWNLAPMATEIERQVISWIAEFIGYPTDCGGLFVSGGNMANFVGFLVARRRQATWNIREEGLRQGSGQLMVYGSYETHTWVHKATDLFGLGTDAMRWIRTDSALKLDVADLEENIRQDLEKGLLPFLVLATAGAVGTGVVDDLSAIGAVARKYDLWYHIDGAYGAPAAGLEEYSEMFEGLADADSIALDPHKWFYAPLEAGCILVKDPGHMTDTFSYRPPYYRFEDYEDAPGINFYEYGPQNSRGFRALKVWTGFQQAGRSGMQKMLRHDIAMAQLLFDLAQALPDFEAYMVSLSIVTFRYLPGSGMHDDVLNTLNEQIMLALQRSGQAFLTNAVVDGVFFLRACFVNFRTTADDVRALPGQIRNIAGSIGAKQ